MAEMSLEEMLKMRRELEARIAEQERELAFLRGLLSALDGAIGRGSFTTAEAARAEAMRAAEAVEMARRPTETMYLRGDDDGELGVVEIYEDEVVLKPKITLRGDGLFDRFFVKKVLERHKKDVGLDYDIEMKEEGKVKAVIVHNYRDEWRRRDIIKAFKWTLERIAREEGAE